MGATARAHPYGDNWKPGHALGYQHPFIATLTDFLYSVARKEAFHANFADAMRFSAYSMQSNDPPRRVHG